MDETFFLVIQPQDQCAEIFAVALGSRVTSDDAFLALRDFDLEPIARALFLVCTASLLRKDSFQPPLLSCFEKIKTLLAKVVGKTNHMAILDCLLQQLLSLLEPDAAQVEAIQIEQVERVIGNRHALLSLQAALAGF